MVKIEGIKDPNGDNIFWFIIGKNNDAIVVDPGKSKPVLQYLTDNGLVADSILITHNHSDHTAGIKDVTDQYHCPVLGPENEDIESITQAFTEGDSFERLGAKFEVLSLPGHASDHIGFIIDGKHFLCGDVIFGAGCGNVPEGTMEQMFESLQKCAALPPKTKLYWGHEITTSNLLFASKVEPDNPDLLKRLSDTEKVIQQNGISAPGTLEEELKTNPFLRVDQATIVKNAEEFAGGKLSTPAEVFSSLRKWKG